MMAYRILLALPLALTLTVAGCNSGSSTSPAPVDNGGGGGGGGGGDDVSGTGTGDPTLGTGDNTSGITDAENLPKATDAVIAALNYDAVGDAPRSRAYRADGGMAPGATVGTLAATVGLPFAPSDDFATYLGEDNYADFLAPGTGSLTACEALNRIRGAYGQLGSADGMSCIIGKLIGSDIADDAFRTTEFVIADDDGEFKVKMRYRILTKDDSISAFEAYYCMPNTDGDYVQEGYTYHDYSGETPKIYAKGFAYPDNPDVESVKFIADIEADGVDEQGRLLDSKSLSYQYENQFTDGRSNHVEADIEVTPDLFTYNGYSCERDIDAEEGECSRVERINLAAQVLDGNEDGERNPNLFALGDGSAWSNMTSTSGIQSWFGDTGEADTGDDPSLDTYRDLVSEAGAKATSAVLTGLDFEDEEVWDCSDEATTQQTGAEALATVMACLDATELDQNIHLDCHSHTQDYDLSDFVEGGDG